MQHTMGMMGMNVEQLQVSARLKAAFFESLEMADDQMDYGNMVQTFLVCLRDFLHAREVAFFRNEPFSKELIGEASAGAEEGMFRMGLIVSAAELQTELNGELYKYGSIETKGLACYDVALALQGGRGLQGVLAMREGEEGSLNLPDALYGMLSKESAKIIHTARKVSGIAAEEQKYRQLFRVTSKFHSSMKMDDVLGEIINALHEVYPSFTYYVMLSHDNTYQGELPIKDLEYDSENIAAMQAYVTGTAQMEDSLPGRKAILYAPLKGKQGVYGVLQVIAPNTMFFPDDEVEFITLLANTAGTAIENAQLYQQSKSLIADLQLINETSHRLNSNLRLNETMGYMREQISKSFNAQEIGFIMYAKDNEVTILPGSSKYFEQGRASVYINYIKERIEREKESLFLGDLQLGGAEGSGFRSIMAVPMVQSGSIKGFAIVMHEGAYHFSFEMFKLLQSLIHHSTLAFTNSMLREELERMVVTDHLTRLYSRNYLDEKLKEAMDSEEEGTFLLIDIDDFKSINDTYGHQVGDDILVQVSNTISNNIRSADIGARWGGEELAVYFPKVNLETGRRIAERIRQAVRDQTHPRVTVSCGLAYWNSSLPDTTKALFKRADTALYKAKNTGKDKVVAGEKKGME